MKKRFIDQRLVGYDSTYLVECPKCGKEASVLPDKQEITIVCYHCMHKAKKDDLLLYMAEVKRNCPECGKAIYHKIDGLAKPMDDLTVKCQDCGFSAEYEARNTVYVPSHDLKGLKGDPYFGYPLWLQTEVKGKLFWARNRDYLDEIRQYVEADLRERSYVYLMTMTARLPEFIKLAKNRDAILKAIERMLNRQ